MRSRVLPGLTLMGRNGFVGTVMSGSCCASASGTATGLPLAMDAPSYMCAAPGDTRALASALTALASNPLRRARLGRAGPERGRERFSVDAMGRALVRVYSGLAGGAPGAAHEAAA